MMALGFEMKVRHMVRICGDQCRGAAMGEAKSCSALEPLAQYSELVYRDLMFQRGFVEVYRPLLFCICWGSEGAFMMVVATTRLRREACEWR